MGRPFKNEFRYTYQDIADFCGIAYNTVEQGVSRKEFNPVSFGSMIAWAARKMRNDHKHLALIMYGCGRGEAVNNPFLKPRKRRVKSK